METLAMLLVVLVIVLLVGGLFAALGARGPWPGIIWFLIVLFVATLAIGAWAEPVGPRTWNVPWLTFLIAALFVALLIAAAMPGKGHPRRRSEPVARPDDVDLATDAEPPRQVSPAQEMESVPTTTAIGVGLWIFIAFAASLLVLALLLAPGVVPVP